MCSFKKYFSLISLLSTILLNTYSFKPSFPEEPSPPQIGPVPHPQIVSLPILLQYPDQLSFTPRIQRDEYMQAIVSTPLIQFSPHTNPAIRLTPGMFLPSFVDLNNGPPVLSWKLSCLECTINNLSGNFGIFDFSNFSKSTIQNSRLNFPRFIGSNLTQTKWHSVRILGGDFYGAIGNKIEIIDSEFRLSRFQEMDFRGAEIRDCSFTNCIITEDCVLPLETIALKNCLFTKCSMPRILADILAAQENVRIIDPHYLD